MIWITNLWYFLQEFVVYLKNGKYGITSGHVEQKEKMKVGALRELKEELGIDIKKEELKLFYNTKIGKNIYNLYHLKKDFNMNNLVLSEQEVERVEWCTKEEIDDLIRKKEFYDIQVESLEIFKKYIKGEERYANYSPMGRE